MTERESGGLHPPYGLPLPGLKTPAYEVGRLRLALVDYISFHPPYGWLVGIESL